MTVGCLDALSGATAASIDVHFRYALTTMECETFANRGGVLDPQWRKSDFSCADEVIEYGRALSILAQMRSADRV
jgi:hypothetical protein